MRLVSLKFLFCFCILEEGKVIWVWVFNEGSPAPHPYPLKRQEARHGQLVPWTDTGAEAVGGGEPRIITGFWSIRPCLTQALLVKTALYGKLMVKLKHCQGHCCSWEATTPQRGRLLPGPGLPWFARTECPLSLARTNWHSHGWVFPLGVSFLLFFFPVFNLTFQPRSRSLL